MVMSEVHHVEDCDPEVQEHKMIVMAGGELSVSGISPYFALYAAMHL